VVILTEADVERIAHLESGTLESQSIAELMVALARCRRTATLEVTRPPASKQIIVERGVPVECRSNLVHETLSRFMVRTGRIEEGVAEECFAESCARGVRFGDVLIERGVIGAEDLRKALQENLVRKLLDVFSWHHGTFRISGIPDALDSSLQVNVPQLVVLGVTRFATQQQVDASIGPLIGRPLVVDPAAFFGIEEIRLNDDQRRLVEALSNASLRIDELAVATDLPFADLTRLLHALTLIGTVVPESAIECRPDASTPDSDSAHAGSPDGASPRAENDATDPRRDELMRLVLNHRRKDAFELLGIDPRHAEAEHEAAYLRFAERFAPWTFEGDLDDEAREVFLAGARAYGQLADAERRRDLLDQRAVSTQAEHVPPGASSFRVHTSLLDPDVQYAKGQHLKSLGRHRDAVDQFAYASKLDPQNVEYRCELAHCRFLSDPQMRSESALEHLEQTLRIDPRCGLALFYTGEILRRLRRFDEAEDAYQRAIKPMAPDRRPIEALREMMRERRDGAPASSHR
jgi:hypothetical protein